MEIYGYYIKWHYNNISSDIDRSTIYERKEAAEQAALKVFDDIKQAYVRWGELENKNALSSSEVKELHELATMFEGPQPVGYDIQYGKINIVE